MENSCQSKWALKKTSLAALLLSIVIQVSCGGDSGKEEIIRAAIMEGETNTGITFSEVQSELAGPDASQFYFNSNNELVFLASPDFEVPSDQNQDNVYQLSSKSISGTKNIIEVSVANRNQTRAEMTFPLGNINVGGIPSIKVSGKIVDLEDGLVSGEDILELDVNGVIAEIEEEGWTVEIPLYSGSNLIQTNIKLVNGENHSHTQHLNNIANIDSVSDFYFEWRTNMLFVTDPEQNAIIKLNLTTGIASQLAYPGEEYNTIPDTFAYSPEDARVFVNVPRDNAIYEFNLDIPNLNKVVDFLELDIGRELNTIYFPTLRDSSIYLSQNNSHLYGLSSGIENIIEMNLTNGVINFIGDFDDEAEPEYFPDRKLFYDQQDGIAFVYDTVNDSLTEVDLDSGEHRDISDILGLNEYNQILDLTYDDYSNQFLILDYRDLFMLNEVSRNGVTQYSQQIKDSPVLFSSKINSKLQYDPNLRYLYQLNKNSGVIQKYEFDYNRVITIVDPQVEIAMRQKEEIFDIKFDSSNGVVSIFEKNGMFTQYQISGNGVVLVKNQQFLVADASSIHFSDESNSFFAVWEDNLFLHYDIDEDFARVYEFDGQDSEAWLNSFGEIKSDSKNNVAYLITDNLTSLSDNKLISIDLKTGERAVVSAHVDFEGPSFRGTETLYLDEQGSRVLTMERNMSNNTRIMAFDIQSGERSIVTETLGDQDFSLNGSSSFAVHSNGQFAIAISNNRIIEIDLITGNKKFYRDRDFQISGPKLNRDIEHLQWDDENNRVFFYNNKRIYVLNLLTGDYTVF